MGPAEESEQEAIPAGLTTLRAWSTRQGRVYDYVRQFWRPRPGFPEPVGELRPRGRHGGGRGEHLYDEAALDGWRSAQSDLDPPERIELSALGISADERVTLGRFAGLIGKDRKTVTQHRDRPGFPAAGEGGKYRAGDLLAYWNARPGRRGKGKVKP